MTDRTKPNIKQRLSRLLLIALTIACVITSGMEPAFAAELSREKRHILTHARTSLSQIL